MTDECRRPMCGHAWAAHDRRGHREACGACGCHSYVTDYRGTGLAVAVLIFTVLFFLALTAITTGVVP